MDVICDILPTDNIEGNERGGGECHLWPLLRLDEGRGVIFKGVDGRR